MTQADTDSLIRQLIGGDSGAIAGLVDGARTSKDPILIVAAALVGPGAVDLLARATGLAANTQERQLVVIAAAHVAGDADLVDAFAREHLVDYPDSILVAWIAATRSPKTQPQAP